MRGFIDDEEEDEEELFALQESQSAFVRGFIDDCELIRTASAPSASLNPRSCAASSMTTSRPTSATLPT